MPFTGEGLQVLTAAGRQGTYAESFTTPEPGVVPLEVAGVAGQIVDFFNINASKNGTKLLWLDSAGILHVPGGISTGGGPGLVDIIEYGAVPGVDSTAAIELAMGVVNASPGLVLYVPPGGIYEYNQDVGGPLNFTQSWSGITGDGWGSVLEFTGTSHDCITFSTANALYQYVRDIFLYAPNLSSNAHYVINISAGNYPKVSGTFVISAGSGVADTSTSAAFQSYYDDVTIGITAASSIGIDLQTVRSSFSFANVRVIGTVAAGTTSIGIRFPLTLSQDTAIFKSCFVVGVNTGVLFDNAAGIGDYIFDGGFIAQTNQYAVLSEGAGNLSRCSFNDMWLDSADNATAGAVVCLAGPVYDFNLNHCRINGSQSVSGSLGVQIQTSASGSVRLNDCYIDLCGGQALQVIGDVTLEVIGGAITESVYALVLGSSASWTHKKTFIGFDVSDPANTTAFAPTSALSTYGPNLQIRNCRGITPYGVVTGISYPATGVYVQNTFPFAVRVFVQAGSGGGQNLVLSPTNSGGTSIGLVPANGVLSFVWEPGEWFASSYSSAVALFALMAL